MYTEIDCKPESLAGKPKHVR